VLLNDSALLQMSEQAVRLLGIAVAVQPCLVHELRSLHQVLEQASNRSTGGEIPTGGKAPRPERGERALVWGT
jgi:hypothetical protein